jgi:hypothetical protein
MFPEGPQMFSEGPQMLFSDCPQFVPELSPNVP